ncbi:MAG TPA: ABC transporter substrate-binding protein [Rhizobiaceae bacterium]|nr:ABC transporter substrate-binding protein [Rhizobiaceae bacterium]
MITRRGLLKGAAYTGLAAGASRLPLPARAAGTKMKLGYVSPQTGPLAAFAAADKFVIDAFLKTTKGMGMDFDVVVKDSQSNANRAARVADELIVNDKVNLMLVSSTPETTNPVSTTCESEGIPCISTVAPWQSWFIGQQSNPTDPKSWKPFNYAYHFFWGLEDVIAAYTNMWAQVSTNKKIGGLFPNDGDGNAWGDKHVGFPPVLDKQGYTLTDPGRYQDLTDDFSAQINAFKQGNCEIVTGVMIPPDFTTFWNQAQQQGFRPKVASIGKALLFPEAVAAVGKSGNNLSTEVWWTPEHPFHSSLTKESSGEVAAAFEKASGRKWTQPIGFTHALFELAADVMKRAKDPTDPDGVVEAIAATKLDTLVGPIAWGDKNLPPFAQKNVAKTPLVGGQWRLQADNSYKLVITENRTAPIIPAGGKMEPIA